MPSEKNFRPMPGAGNPHLQTLLPRLIRQRLRITPYWQRLDTPDGDFLDLAWSEDPLQARHKPRMVLFHGLEGNIYSPYAHGLLSACRQRGWLGVVMHFRGCSGKPNRMGRIYHSGETEDARYLLEWMQQTLGKVPIAAAGFSLGGNMLACLLARRDVVCLPDAAVIVSAPLMLEPCGARIEHGVSRLYQHYLLRLLKQNVRRKMMAYPDSLPFRPAQLKKLRRLRDFDDLITAPLHGFRDALDYYRRCSALPRLLRIRTPLLIIQAKDDPFMAPAVIPDLASLPDNIEYQLTERGGHVGFVGGSVWKPEMWLEQRIPAWLTQFLDK
ncbi:hydrolase [Affinibrenneria salicis]|uniref:Hydrolase n=1 Tax=Affinibrenneria salicis TaxID=2590031 RepID=A0A5J5FTM6_9GAMM|nr:hydrolase [Affinibrenneria salicis]KAA8996489.1 hydrolase [Affinibrenneria salicis]